MTNFRLILSTLLFACLFSACVASTDKEQESPELGYNLLQQGRRYLKNDEYPSAINRFNQALVFYESYDDMTGIAHCHFGLAEAAIALGKLDVAKKYLRDLNAVEDEAKIDRFYSMVTMLDVKIDYLSGMYGRAIEKLEPLLPEFDDTGRLSQKVDLQTLNVTASRTLLAFKTDFDQAKQWTKRFEDLLFSYGKESPAHNASLDRFNAQILVHNKAYNEAEEFLGNALAYYKETNNRRGIAATLRELGLLMIAQHRWAEADDLLHRALKIRTLIIDSLGTTILLNDLIAMNKTLGNDSQVVKYQEMLLELDKK
jgi:tetratricopeptide (TPR) repeat protein